MAISKMRELQSYLANQKVHKASPDPELARALQKNVEEREKSTLKLKSGEFPLLVFENLYDCLRELLDALLALEGYKSYSHEASIAYLRNFPEVSEEKLRQLDRYRVKRNNSKYYGKSPSTEDADEIKKFYGENKDLFKKIIRSKLK